MSLAIFTLRKRFSPAAIMAARNPFEPSKEIPMSLGTILLIILILALIGALPLWPYSSGWGYYPTGGIGLIVVILIILLVLGRI
jgi:FtsH-binding integral membrane protein